MAWMKSRRLHYFAGGIAILFAAFALLRLVFLFAFSGLDLARYAATGDLWTTLLIGLRFDFRLAILVMLPLAFLLMFPRFNMLQQPWLRHAARGYLGLSVVLIALLYVLDFGHYDYLGVRINATVFRFTGNTDISTSMLWQSYPVIWISIAWLLGAALLLTALIKLETLTLRRPAVTVSKGGKAAAWLVTSVAIFFGLLGRVSDINFDNPVPLRWS